MNQKNKGALESSRYWRTLAEEAREMAVQHRDPVAKVLMQDIANKYDHMAERAARKEAGSSGPTATS